MQLLGRILFFVNSLRQNPNFYHILHFDGHGSYGVMPDSVSGFTFKGSKGCLVFENKDGKENVIQTEQLSALLREHAVPAVVLNACRSGMIDQTAQDPFASVAAALLKSGVRSVVAMAYSLYVSAAQVFLPEFYRILFEDGIMEKAVRAGRQQMLSNLHRTCVRGQFPLRDWLVPVLYQQEALDFSFAAGADKQEKAPLPPEIENEDSIYEFTGRDRAILELERAMRVQTPAILIQGLGGVGKTTLAKNFLKWLKQTDGLGEGSFWFAFNEIHNAEAVINLMGKELFGDKFLFVSLEQRLHSLCEVLKKDKFLIISIPSPK
jgi:CHAT domain-containing protein